MKTKKLFHGARKLSCAGALGAMALLPLPSAAERLPFFGPRYCLLDDCIAARELSFVRSEVLRQAMGTLPTNHGKTWLLMAHLPADFVQELGVPPSGRKVSDAGLPSGRARAMLAVSSTVRKGNYDDLDMVFLYSNDLKLLKKFSEDFAHPHGIIVAGTAWEILYFLRAFERDSETRAWWGDSEALPIDILITLNMRLPGIVAVGRTQHPAKLLEIPSWEDIAGTNTADLKTAFDSALQHGANAVVLLNHSRSPSTTKNAAPEPRASKLQWPIIAAAIAVLGLVFCVSRRERQLPLQ